MKKPGKNKTVEELTKGFEELAKKKGWKGSDKSEFEKNVKKISDGSKDNQK